ncbi:MAG: RNA polymerase sigma factor SigJ, partial [Hyphomicrobiaceae bacterium]|nr:RNA polymerase sigma factor SigJ [Hyphomicrobiaceae bacterium]
AFFAASRNGDMARLRSLLAADVVITADGGGKVPAAVRPVAGIDDVMRVHTALARVFAEHGSRLVRYGLINGLPGFITIEAGNTLQTTAFHIDGDRIAGVYVVRNPDKLRHLGAKVAP